MFRSFDFWIIAVAILLVLILLYIYGLGTRDAGKETVSIDGHEFSVDVANTMLLRERGLAGREHLGEDEGMLFVFDSVAPRRFWMKGMLIPIDIIWVNDGKVAGFAENVEPEPGASVMSLKIYASPIPVKYVLEVQAGTVERIGIKDGNSVSISL